MSQHFTDINDPELVQLIKNGAIGVIPTDTVYGLVAQASNPDAIAAHYAVKNRELAPGTMIGPSVQSFAVLGFRQDQLDKVAHYWPAPLSVVLDASNVSDYLKHKRPALPVRIPADKKLQKLLEQTGPLMTTSANRPGEPTSTSVDEAIDYFGDAIDFYVDGGNLGVRPPSTIVGFDGSNLLVVYREGAVPASHLK